MTKNVRPIYLVHAGSPASKSKLRPAIHPTAVLSRELLVLRVHVTLAV